MDTDLMSASSLKLKPNLIMNAPLIYILYELQIVSNFMKVQV